MTRRQAMDFIRYHGVVLEAARGLEPTLAERLVGEPIRGSWWSHPRARAIFALASRLHDSPAVLVCTLAAGRITYVHRRLWPPFVRLAHRFPGGTLDRVRQVHLPSGRHERRDIPFPEWVPGPVAESARSLTDAEAQGRIGIWIERYGKRQGRTRR